MSTTSQIVTGIWPKYDSESSHTTWTLTVRQRDGGIISSALVLFVGFSVTQAWNVAKFILHQLQAGAAKDGYQQQLQAMLRNSSTHSEAAWYAIRIPLGWRKQGGFLRALARASPILIVALSFTAIWVVAQIVLPRLWTDASDVFLVDSRTCRWATASFVVAGPYTSMVYRTQRAESASAYVDLCYEDTQEHRIQESSCQRLPRARLDYTMSDAPCPFVDPSLCISTNSTPVNLDTGYLSSSAHFGVNARREDSVLYRRWATCSPVTTAHQDSPEQGVINFYYGGHVPYYDVDAPHHVENDSNATYTYHERPHTFEDSQRQAYIVHPFYANMGDIYGEGGWRPNTTITEYRQEVRVSMMFITNTVHYMYASHDPVFGGPNDAGYNRYNASSPVSILGCIEKHEICNPAIPGEPKCVTYAGLDSLQPLNLSDWQLGIVARLNHGREDSDIAYAASGSTPIASRGLFNGEQLIELPRTQWRVEVSRWFAMGLTMLQQSFVDSVTKPGNPGQYLYDASYSGSCRRQTVRNALGFQNFDVQVLAIIVSLGTVIIVLGSSIDVVVGAIQRRYLKTSDGWVHWTLHGTFQLLRLAYRGVGVPLWHDEDTDIPTMDGMPLPPVDRERMAFSGWQGQGGWKHNGPVEGSVHDSMSLDTPSKFQPSP